MQGARKSDLFWEGKMNPEEILQVAVVDAAIHTDTPTGRAVRNIIGGLADYGINVTTLASTEDARSALSNLPAADCILVSWNLGEWEAERTGTKIEKIDSEAIVAEIRKRNEEIPVFLMGEPTSEPPKKLPIELIKGINEFVWVMDDTAEFLAGRITAAARRYRERLLPPFFSEMVNFSRDFEYSWHTPGHAGGTAFRKSPAGRAFFNFFGEQLFRSDLSISVGELGSLLDHSGPVGDAERYAAKVFGADSTYFVTNGTSTSNKIVFFGRVTADDIVLVDRNCHKSAEHSLTLTHAVPIYLIPTRNRYGIIGPIHPEEFNPERIKKKIEDSPLTKDLKNKTPIHSIITNSTYDGLCYDAEWVESELGKSVDSIHFDEAWYGYARFNPMYRKRFAMRDGIKITEGPTVFATQSTHKLLAALSQASMVHVRNGRVPIDHSRFNEAFMMHTSTSPLYTIIASCDVSAKMMDGASGRMLTQEPIEEAIRFRRMMARIKNEIGHGKTPRDWWFGMWQPDFVTDPATKKKIAFADASIDLLGKEPSCWVLHPEDKWHGFTGLPDDYCMLDPIKVTVLMPGVKDDGTPADWGIPAAIVVKFLDTRGIVNEKSGDYNILFLFSMGITKGKWGTLVTELFEFKRHWEEGSSLEEVFPDLVKEYPEKYAGITLPEFVNRMHSFMKDNKQGYWLEQAYKKLPKQVMTYAKAYKCLVRDEVELVAVSKMEDRIVATGVFPYPPGIPVLAPGESAGKKEGPIIKYLLALQKFDENFPGFEHDIHGVENVNGTYKIYCLK